VRLANNGSFTFSVQAATEKLAPITAPLAIRTQPANTNVNAGQAASFSVTAAGNAPFGYQWKRNGIDIPGATGPSYTTPALAFADNGALYSVVVSNGSGSIASANATVAIKTGPLGPGITSDPVSYTSVLVGSTPTLSVVSTGFAPTYQWRRNGVDIAGANGLTYTLPAATIADDGAWYSVLVCNASGCVTSQNAQLQVAKTASPAVTQIAANRDSLALRDDGTVWAWGTALGGALSLARPQAAIASQGHPAQAMCAAAVPFTDAVAIANGGGGQSIVARRDGTAWSTGANGAGQLGDGTVMPRTALAPVLTAPGMLLQNVRAIAAGLDASHAVTADGSAWAWGNNAYGQLGDGTTTSRRFAVRVRNADATPFAGVASVKAGTIHTLWLKTDGTVWAAGHNIRGQLGDGSGIARANPVRVETAPGAALSNVVAIAAGVLHGVALRSDGTAFTWGAALPGTPDQLRPVVVRDAAGAVLTGIIAVAAGGGSSFFVLADGTVLASGSNSSGQLGIGTAPSATVPTPVRDANGAVFGNVRAVATQSAHTLALRTDGSVWAWGENNSMRLGDGTATPRFTPVRVQGLRP
jgi:alpha-tubulin suppressor-like RCC1 family protein